MAREVARDAVTQLQQRLDAVCESVETERSETLQRIEEGLEQLNSINSAVLAQPAWRNVEIPSKTPEPSLASPVLPVQNRMGSE